MPRESNYTAPWTSAPAPAVPKLEFSPALKEIAGRLTKLSFRDMNTLALMLTVQLPAPVEASALATSILTVADAFGGEV